MTAAGLLPLPWSAAAAAAQEGRQQPQPRRNCGGRSGALGGANPPIAHAADGWGATAGLRPAVQVQGGAVWPSVAMREMMRYRKTATGYGRTTAVQ